MAGERDYIYINDLYNHYCTIKKPNLLFLHHDFFWYFLSFFSFFHLFAVFFTGSTPNNDTYVSDGQKRTRKEKKSIYNHKLTQSEERNVYRTQKPFCRFFFFLACYSKDLTQEFIPRITEEENSGKSTNRYVGDNNHNGCDFSI
jgi:hypothetical protein